jgi:cytochrome b6-f complex iron-sulfur subunit
LTENPHPRVSRSQFIRLGAALGVGAAASSTLAACGGGSETGGSGGSGGGEESAASEESVAPEQTQQSQAEPSEPEEEAAAPSGDALASESELAPGSAMPFKDGGGDAVLVHLESGEFVAYSAICTHQACTVAYQEAQLVCPCHGSVFDPANGAAVVNGPAQTPLQEIPVEVRDGEVFKA